MLSRITRSLMVLVGLIAVYQVYLFTVVPWVEPPELKRSEGTIDEQARRDSYDAFDRYRELLSNYFPAGHWTLAKPAPKLLRFGSFMVVVKDYRRHDDGSVDLDECAVLLMPQEWEFGSGAPRDTVILEAPNGAHLQFDDDFQPAQGKAGRIVYGRFPGEITIRSDMKLPGTDDDLLISTSNLEMNDTRIYTEANVLARLGKNVGTGRKMNIRLLRDEHIKRGPSIVGVKSLEVIEDVRLRLEPEGLNVLEDQSDGSGGDKVARNNQRNARIQLVSAEGSPTAFRPMVEVTCQGRFFFDLINFIASFDRRVIVSQQRLDGSFDQIDCDELAIQFSSVDENNRPIIVDDPNESRRQRQVAGRFKAMSLTATGHPVRAESPAQQASARANRVTIDLFQRRIVLDESREVSLKYGGSEIHAQRIDYQMPEKQSPSALGELQVAGQGWLRAVPDVERPDRVIDIAWKSSPNTQFPLQLTRRNQQPILMLSGDPVIDAHRLGKISAQRMELVLREVPADGDQGPAIEITSSPTKLAIQPERLMASGKVVFASPKLTGSTHQLQGDFLQRAARPAAVNSNNPNTSAVSNRIGLADNSNRRTSQYDLSANQIRLRLAIDGKSADATAVDCEGSVVLRETQTARDGEEPLEVRGRRLRADGLDADANITVFGRRDPQLGAPGTATITARGLTLAAEKIHADQESSRFWIDGPGIAKMNVGGEAFGQQPGSTTPVTFTWQKGLDAAGRRIVASGRILAESQQGWVQADRAVALLTEPLRMGRNSAGKVDVAQVALEGNVVGNHRGVDETGPTSRESFQLKTLTYDRLTGNVQGTGPGILRSVRLSDGDMNFADLASATNPRQPNQPANKPRELRFLRIDFADGLSGNVEQRVVRFHGRVKSVYGPIDTWDDELPLHAPDRLPFDTVTLSCETLEVNEDPVARRLVAAKSLGPLEIRAKDNVEIEGRSEKDGVFQAQAVTASYSQHKDVFLLRGNGQQEAVLYHRNPLSGQYETIPAGTIVYHRSEPRVELKDVHRPIEFQQTAPRAGRPNGRPAVGPIR